MSTLFEDIIILHILSRLPVESLIRYRRVCKSWRYKLSNPDPQFIRSHITHTSKNPDYECLIISTLKNNHMFSRRCSMDIISRSRLSYTRMDNVPRYFYQTVGSINGLVCSINYCKHMFLLWNPVTGLCKTIVPPQHYLENKMLFYGFGWDYVESQFKIVILYQDRKLKSLQGVVYTSNSDSCDEIVIPDIFSRTQFFHHPITIVEGCPYWDAYRGRDGFLVKFVSTSNQFKEFLKPSQITRYHRHIYANVNDCLALIVQGPLVHVFHLDEECGAWSKTYTFGPICCYVGPNCVNQCFKYGGEIVFGFAKKLYDPKTNGIKVISDGYQQFVSGYSYTPSFVFLRGMEPLHTQSQSPEVESSVLTPAQSHLRLLFSRLLECLGWN